MELNRDTFTDEELLAYTDERLAISRASQIEMELRTSKPLCDRLLKLIQSRDQGDESLGDMWRRGQWSCPTRSIWRAFVEERLGDGIAQYLRFHLDIVGCHICSANLADLIKSAPTSDTERRVRKIFQSSAGKLARNND